MPEPGALELVDKTSQRRVGPIDVKSFAEAGEPMAIVFVMSGQEVFVGNESLGVASDETFPGLLDRIEAAIDQLDLAHRLPSGSTAGIVTYDNGAKLRLPLSPIAQLHGASFGTQVDYFKAVANDLVRGVQLGLDELERSTASKKLLVVLGDGNDTNADTGTQQLAELKKRAMRAGIRVEAIVYRTEVSRDGTDIRSLVAEPRMLASRDDTARTLTNIFDEVTQIFYARFDVRDLPLWDDKEHELVVRVDGHELELESPFPRPPASASSQAWWKSLWAQLAFGLAAIGVLVVLARRASR
jgi:hypothetical protein